eukprot:Transcript_28067.p2 GENE.Transcript_28067~~Transcript_28067.p2  ORF type:complete len:194 (+),score=94.37 Transcript_28067:455-1036(+)
MAEEAYKRAGCLHSAVTWHAQLSGRAKQIESTLGSFQSKGGSGDGLSKPKLISRLLDLLELVSKTISDIFGDASFASTTAEMARRNIPQQLEQEAEALRCACLPLAEHAHRLAVAELKGLKAEKALTQKFRAPQSHAVLEAALHLAREVNRVAHPVASLPEATLTELTDGIAEVQPMIASGGGADDDELDDEI